MKTIGLIGGVSWASTMEYYKRLNTRYDVEILIHSFNFVDVLKYQKENNVEEESKLLINAAKSLERSGAEIILICSNTTNKTAHIIEREIEIPLIDIIKVTSDRIHESGYSKVGLLATNHTVDNKLYDKYLHNVDIILPTNREQQLIHNVIYRELCNNIILPDSKIEYVDIVLGLISRGAEAIILGCTEIPLLITQDDFENTRIIDTVQIHIESLGIKNAPKQILS